MLRAIALLCLFIPSTAFAQAPPFAVRETDDFIHIESAALEARVRKKGYVSGTAAGSFIDKKTGAHDLGFGLDIMDFLLGPGWKDDGYGRDANVHGNLPKHYIEGPQICTQAKKLEPKIIQGKDYLAVTMNYRFTQGHNGYQPGSLWEQTLIFPGPKSRFIVCQEKITSANDVDNVFYRIDMPGHIKHKKGDSFSQIYLSYFGTIPAAEFQNDFAPDARFLYQRKEGQKVPERFIRAYQVNLAGGKPGPWLAGMTLDPSLVHEAWCHQRGYVCFIQELWGRKIQKGQTIEVLYLVGYFDDIADMNLHYDRYRQFSSVRVDEKELKFHMKYPLP